MTIEQLKKLLDKHNLHNIVPEKLLSFIIKKDDESIIRVIKNMAKYLNTADKCRPWVSLFNEMAGTETLIMFVDNHFQYLREKYKPYGLNLPFKSYNEAKEFLKKESLEGVLNTPRIEPTKMNGMDLWQADQNVYMASMIVLDFEKLKNGYNGIICNSSPFLLELKKAVDTLELYTGFDSPSLLEFFFCGTKPKLARVLATKTDFIGNVYRIQINTVDVTREEFDSLYNMYKEATKTKYKKRLSDKAKAFALFLQKKNIPEKPTAETFTEWMDEWNKLYPDWKVDNWRAMRSKYFTYQRKNIEFTPFLNSLLDNNKQEAD